MRRFFLTLLLFGFIFLAMTGADTGIAGLETVFLPREYYVGDKVELRISLRIEEGYSLQLPDILPESTWVDFYSIEIVGSSKKPELRIVFASFIPGTRTLPPLRFGEVLLDTVKIHTSSLVDSSDVDFVGIADQILLPGTRIIFTLALGGILLGPVALLLLLGPFRKKIKALIEAARGRKPFKKLTKKLKELEEQRESISCRRFYIRLSLEVREYLSKRSSVDFTTLTTYDMGLALKRVVKNDDISEQVYKMMKLADIIKFGRETTNDSRKVSDIVLVRIMCSMIEADAGLVHSGRNRK